MRRSFFRPGWVPWTPGAGGCSPTRVSLDCLPLLEQLGGLPRRAALLPGQRRVEHRLGPELSAALARGFGEVLGADALTLAVNRALCQGALPIAAAVEVALGEERDLEPVLAGVGRAARALGVGLERVSRGPGATSIRVSLGVRPLREPESARAGDAPFVLPANGPSAARREALCEGLDALSALERDQQLRAIYAPQRSYLSLLHRPLHEGWYRSAALVEDDDVARATALLAPQWRSPPLEAVADASASLDAQPPGLVVVVAGEHARTFADHVAAWGETASPRPPIGGPSSTPDLPKRST